MENSVTDEFFQIDFRIYLVKNNLFTSNEIKVQQDNFNSLI